MTSMERKTRILSKHRVLAMFPASDQRTVRQLAQKSRISYAYHMIWSRLRELEKEGAIVRTNFRPARFRRALEIQFK